MKTEIVELSQIHTNTANPRHIKDDKFTKLVNSILVFPKMLDLRPIVVDDAFVSLGGNMRFRGLSLIADMAIGDLKARLCDVRDFQKKTEAEKDALVSYWERWQDKPSVTIIKASGLSNEEQRQFIIKDNVGYGEWDMDMLENEWEAEDLEDWGLDVCHDRAPDYSIIDDLENNAFIDKVKNASDAFGVTFLFKKEYKEVVENYLKKMGKELLTNLIISKICQDVEAK